MSDTGDDFNAWKKLKQEKRASNRESSAEMLTAAGITFETKNLDAHLIVSAPAALIDFWPGTELWIVRGNKTQRRGVKSLIAYINREKTKCK